MRVKQCCEGRVRVSSRAGGEAGWGDSVVERGGRSERTGGGGNVKH